MASKNTIVVRFVGDDNQLQRTFRTVASGATKTESRLVGFTKGATKGVAGLQGSLAGLIPTATGVGTAFAALAGADVVGRAFGAMISGADEARRVTAQTNAVIASTGGAAGLSAVGIAQLSDKLSGLVGVDDEIVQQGANVLATFTKIRNEAGAGNDVFNQALGLSLDLSKALGTDLQSAVKQVGKALNDPVGGMTALSRAGVQFTDQQKEQIRTLVQSGDQLGAQKLILNELVTQVGGVAEATATPLDKLKVRVDNIAESLGAGLLPVLDSVAVGLDKLSEKASSALGIDTSNFIPDFVTGTLKQAIPFGNLLTFLGAEGDDASASQKGLANSVRAVGASTDEAAPSVKSLESAEKSLQGSANGLRSAQEALADSHRGVEDASRGVTKAQEGVAAAHRNTQRAQEGLADAEANLNRLLAQGAVDAKEVADAHRQLESATRGVQSANESLADAQARLNEALKGADPSDVVDAELALERATLGVAQARKSAADSHKAKAGRDPLDEASAELALREAIENQNDARTRLEELKAQGSATDQAVISAQRGVRDAAQQVADAIQSQNDAAARLREAQAGDPAWHEAVAQAKRSVRDAAQQVRDAQMGERDAAQGVRDAQRQVADAQDRVRDAEYQVRDASYALRSEWANLQGEGWGVVGVIDAITARAPELAGILAGLGAVGAAASMPGGTFINYGGQIIPGGFQFAEGGWVPGRPGQPQIATVHGGEYVMSRDMLKRGMGGGNTTVHVTVQGSVITEQDLAKSVQRALLQQNKGGVRWGRN